MTSSGDSQDDTYSYDLNGNRDSTGYTTGAGNELTNSPGATYTYDNDGNMISQITSAGTTTYTYDYHNRLTGVDQYGTVVATYTYNALGQRIGIKEGGTQTWTVYNGSGADANPYADFNSSGSVTMRYLDGLAVDQLLAQTSSSGVTWWNITDKLGSVEDYVTTSGTVLNRVTYDSFGNVVTETNATDSNRFLFAGMEYDSTTGLYYDHARYYDAVTGRFVSQDPMGFAAGDTDIYRYVMNSPTDDVDNTGLLVIKVGVTTGRQRGNYRPETHVIVVTPTPGSVIVAVLPILSFPGSDMRPEPIDVVPAGSNGNQQIYQGRPSLTPVNRPVMIGVTVIESGPPIVIGVPGIPVPIPIPKINIQTQIYQRPGLGNGAA